MAPGRTLQTWPSCTLQQQPFSLLQEPHTCKAMLDLLLLQPKMLRTYCNADLPPTRPRCSTLLTRSSSALGRGSAGSEMRVCSFDTCAGTCLATAWLHCRRNDATSGQDRGSKERQRYLHQRNPTATSLRPTPTTALRHAPRCHDAGSLHPCGWVPNPSASRVTSRRGSRSYMQVHSRLTPR